jgi:hypothetical protein
LKTRGFLWIQDNDLLKPCSVVFIAVYNKCVILLSKWVTLNAAPCRLTPPPTHTHTRMHAHAHSSDLNERIWIHLHRNGIRRKGMNNEQNSVLNSMKCMLLFTAATLNCLLHNTWCIVWVWNFDSPQGGGRGGEEVRQCRYKVTQWRFRVTIVAMKMKKCLPFILLTYECGCQQSYQSLTIRLPTK